MCYLREPFGIKLCYRNILFLQYLKSSKCHIVCTSERNKRCLWIIYTLLSKRKVNAVKFIWENKVYIHVGTLVLSGKFTNMCEWIVCHIRLTWKSCARVCGVLASCACTTCMTELASDCQGTPLCTQNVTYQKPATHPFKPLSCCNIKTTLRFQPLLLNLFFELSSTVCNI